MKRKRNVYGDSEQTAMLRKNQKVQAEQGKVLKKIVKEIKIMAQTLQDLKDAITEIGAAVEADTAQDIKVVEAINALIAKIEQLGQGADFQAEVDALKAASSKLSSDNAAVQAAIDAATPPQQ